jgi:nucleotide-binding universal stress UspA family protein
MGPGSDKVLAYAAELAKQTGGKVRALHIITEEEEEDRRHKPGSATEPLDEILRVATEADAEHSEYVDQMLAKTRLDLVNSLVDLGVAESSVTAITRTGEPVQEIHRVAAETDFDAFVIGLRHRSRVGKFLLGSHLQELLLSSDRPVIAVPIGSVGR